MKTAKSDFPIFSRLKVPKPAKADDGGASPEAPSGRP